jgi:hypothetical protein
VSFQPVLVVPRGEKATWASNSARLDELGFQLQTGEGSYITPDYSAGDIPVPFDLAVAATRAEDKDKGIKPTRIVVMSVGTSLMDGYLKRRVEVHDAEGGTAYDDPPRANADLPINSIYWLIGRPGLISSGPVQATMREIPQTLRTVLVAAYCVLLPLLVVAIGGLVMYRRSR